MAKVSIKGGDKLYKALERISKKLNKKNSVKVGFLENSTSYSSGIAVPTVAAFMEYGTPNAQFPIPPRPFFRTMIAEKENEWPRIIEAALVNSDYDAEVALRQLGAIMVSDLKLSIQQLQSPKLSEVTLVLRKKRLKDADYKVTRRSVYEAIAEVKAGKLSGLSGTAAKPLIDPSAGADSGLLLKSVDMEVR